MIKEQPTTCFAGASNFADRICGVLVGTAVGDAIGLPAEGISTRRIKRLWNGQWRHRFVLGRGMISDDTEHTLFVAQSLLAQSADAERFQVKLAWKFRWWLIGLPAGIGMATAKSILKLWMAFSPGGSGVVSAGNGPAMRSAILGAYFWDSPEQLREFVSASTELTHKDPKANVGALAVAEAVAWECAASGDRMKLLSCLQNLSNDAEWCVIMSKLRTALEANASVEQFAADIGCATGVSGYIYQTVPVAIFAWLRHYGDFRAAVEAALNCGGDTDSVGAITGALAGATVGVRNIPLDWKDDLAEWPRSCELLERVGQRLAQQQQTNTTLGPVQYFWPALIPRNLLFLIVVLLHGFRRLLPPY